MTIDLAVSTARGEGALRRGGSEHAATALLQCSCFTVAGVYAVMAVVEDGLA